MFAAARRLLCLRIIAFVQSAKVEGSSERYEAGLIACSAPKRVTQITRAANIAQPRQQLPKDTGTIKLTVAKRVIENSKGDICSFYLAPADQQPLPYFEPGQFLQFSFDVLDKKTPVTRCYSLSMHPTNPQDFYRISVKRLLANSSGATSLPPGLISNSLHDQLREGMIVEALPPAGSFCLDQRSQRPIVLIAGGIGITPLISMLDWLAGTQSSREIWIFYGVRNSQEHAFRNHLDLIGQSLPNLHRVVFYSQPTAACQRGVDYDEPGHVHVDYMKRLLKARNYEFYVCGPSSMMRSITQDLLGWGVPQDAIMSESFGTAEPASPTAPVASDNNATSLPSNAAAQRIYVEFARTKKKVAWTGRQNSLLELAEACGARPKHSCRAGQCGTCKIALHSGQVEYISQPASRPEEGTCLPCIARPTTDLVLDL